MVDLKLIIASNIIKLRTDAGMTQSELGAKLNYSDKSISKCLRIAKITDSEQAKPLVKISTASF